MRVLFIHQNYPGQYGRLAKALVSDKNNQVIAIGEKKRRPKFDYPMVEYATPQATSPHTHHYLRNFEAHVRRGQQVARACLELKKRGFTPDVICAHPGWGETLFIKDAFPSARLLMYCEFFYRPAGSDMGFDPEFPATLDGQLSVRIKNSTQLHGLNDCTAGISPTNWQKSQYPALYQNRIAVIHEGINTEVVTPDSTASLKLGENGPTLNVKDEVITFVARNLEPYRGFHSFVRALPLIQKMRPKAQVLIIGGNNVSYGRRPPKGKTYKDMYLSEVKIDPAKVHFLGHVPYPVYLSALHISSAHVYLTYPFVLSWSFLESMSAGCLVIGSKTAPVQEVIKDGENGFLVDFFSPEEIARKIDEALKRRNDLAPMRQAARQSVIDRFDHQTRCLPAQLDLVKKLSSLKT